MNDELRNSFKNDHELSSAYPPTNAPAIQWTKSSPVEAEKDRKNSLDSWFFGKTSPPFIMNNRREVVSAFKIAATWRQLASQLFFHGVPFRQKAALLIYLLPYNLSLLIWELQSGSVTLFLHCCRCSVHGICPCKIFELELIHTRMKIMLSM